MALVKRKMQCELVVENFIKKYPKFSGTNEWLLTEFRMSNGGDTPFSEGPFRENQFYLNTSELSSAYPLAGLKFMEKASPTIKMEDYHFPVIWNALLACSSTSDEAPMFLYIEGEWKELEK